MEGDDDGHRQSSASLWQPASEAAQTAVHGGARKPRESAPAVIGRSRSSADVPWSDEAFVNTYITARLAPTAERILAAAYRVLAREGYGGLTLRRIAEEAGEHKSLVTYHFQSKSALIALLVDYLWHDADVALVEKLRALPEESQPRVAALIAAHEAFAGDAARNQMYIELLARVVRDAQARQRLARVYEGYRQLNVSCLDRAQIAADRVQLLGSVLLAVGEGLPVQVLVNQDAFDTRAAFELLSALTWSYVQSGGTSPTTGEDQAVSGLVAAVAGLNEHAPRAVGGEALFPLDEAATTHEGRSIRAAKLEDLRGTPGTILKGARRVLRRRGLDGVTFEAVAAASGEARSSVSYHFGDKQGLLVALINDVLQDQHEMVRRILRRSLRQRAVVDIQALLGAGRAYLSDLARLRSFYDLLPAVLRDEAARERLAEWQRGLRATIATIVAGDAALSQSEPFVSAAALSLAALHGLAIQAIIDPVGFSAPPALEVLGELLRELPRVEYESGTAGPQTR